MFKIVFLCLGVISVLCIPTRAADFRVNACKALTIPNSFLLDRFSKIKLKKRCAVGPLLLHGHNSHMTTGCYYKIPASWATSINYEELKETGLFLRASQPSKCPVLSYKNFNKLTAQGSTLIDENKWYTAQVNKFKRLLMTARKKVTEPSSIFPAQELELRIHSLNSSIIPVIVDQKRIDS